MAHTLPILKAGGLELVLAGAQLLQLREAANIWPAEESETGLIFFVQNLPLHVCVAQCFGYQNLLIQGAGKLEAIL